MKTRCKKNAGFTLIEMIIVVAIVSILAAIAVPTYQEQVRKSRRADVMDILTDCAAVQARNFSTASPPSYYTGADLAAGGNAAGLCNNLVSKDGFYTLAVTNNNPANCNDANGATWCFLITAVPAAGGSQVADTRCATWTIDHRDRKTALDDQDNDTTLECWRS